MTNEELILERLDRIEARLSPMAQTASGIGELWDDLTPLTGQAIRLLIRELEDVESSFQLEDLLLLVKKSMASIHHISFALTQLGNLVDFITTIEPLLKSAVPQAINYLDDLEQKGVLRIIQSMLDIRAKVAAAYTPEDIEQIGDSFVSLLGLVKKMSDPKAIEFLESMAELPAKVDLEGAKAIGPFGMIGAASSKEVKQGLGVMIELTKAMGKLKNGGDNGDKE
jgi:uncharacterized protein YjgD (DUF1641 family)